MMFMIDCFNEKYHLTTFVLVCLVSCGQCDFEPLLLSPYLRAGLVAEARDRALVVPDMHGRRSFSGFLTVNEDCGTHLFFWFIPARTSWESAPVLLWLNGGPGASSLIGAFQENGPFRHTATEGFSSNTFTWARDNNMVHLDQPEGAGFSFTRGGCYATNLTTVAREAYSAIAQFFTLFPILRKNNFFLTGESFCGQYIPAIASEIHDRNEDCSGKINLKGIVIGNPLIDIRCIKDSSYLFQVGVIDEHARDTIAGYETQLVGAVNEKNYSKAQRLDDLISKAGIEKAGVKNPQNFLLDDGPNVEYAVFVRNYNVRRQLHVGNTSYSVVSRDVLANLRPLIYESSASHIEKLLNAKKYAVVFYSGQLDSRDPYTSLECALRGLQWAGAEEYLGAARRRWYVGDRLAGWSKTSGVLTEVVVRGAGHMVLVDQSAAALALITAVVNGDLQRQRP